MDLERAKRITAQCVRACIWRVTGGEPQALPSDCSLEEMLIANRMVSEAPPEERVNEDGSTSYVTYMRVDPRGIALEYAFAAFGSDPRELIEALGYQCKASEDEESDDE